MARPRKTKEALLKEYAVIVGEILKGSSYRSIAKTYGIGLSTVMRIKKKLL